MTEDNGKGISWATVLVIVGIMAPFIATGTVYTIKIPDTIENLARYRDESRAARGEIETELLKFEVEMRKAAADINTRLALLEDDLQELNNGK